MGASMHGDVRRVATRLLRLSRSLGAGGSYRGEALRRVVQRLARSLESVAAARGQADLVDPTGGSADVMSDIELSVDGLRRLTQGAQRRVWPWELSYATQYASPSSNRRRGMRRPMKTITLSRVSPGCQGLPGEPPISMCTPWKIIRWGWPWMLSTPL